MSRSANNLATKPILSHPSSKTNLQYDDKSDGLLEIWRDILNGADRVEDRKLAIDLSYLHHIPNELRSNAWFIMSGARDLMHKNRNVYEYLIELSANKKSLDQIEKDLSRTFRSKEMSNKYGDKLKRILIGYSNFNPSLMYTQGMNYIAAFILKQYFEKAPTVHFIDNENENESETKIENEIINEYWTDCIEEQSFWTFTAIMSQIGTLFSNDLYGFHVVVECFNKIFNYHGPKDLVYHLNEENVYTTIFTTWYHTLFTHPAMNENMAKRIWDIFIMEQMDFSIILKISYLLLIRHKNELMKRTFIQITEFCKSSQCFSFGGMDDHDLIYRASKLQLNELFLKPIRNLKYVENINKKQKNKEEEEEDNKTLDRFWSYFKMFTLVPK